MHIYIGGPLRGDADAAAVAQVPRAGLRAHGPRQSGVHKGGFSKGGFRNNDKKYDNSDNKRQGRLQRGAVRARHPEGQDAVAVAGVRGQGRQNKMIDNINS